jgi:hypothetical protein
MLRHYHNDLTSGLIVIGIDSRHVICTNIEVGQIWGVNTLILGKKNVAIETRIHTTRLYRLEERGGGYGKVSQIMYGRKGVLIN